MTNELDHTKMNPFEADNLVYVRRMATDELQAALPPNALADLDEMDLSLIHI